MESPSLITELPPPPAGQTGWPWTEAAALPATTLPDGLPWPRVTIVTSSFQQAAYLEETLRSVLLQGYPNLEYLVVDGGSTDGSVEIIRKYEPWLTAWVSEPDRGHAHAVNKGFARATGDILAWLNSDDTYLPGALARIVAIFHQDPSVRLVYGSAYFTDEASNNLHLYPAKPLAPGLARLRYWDGWWIPQPATFFDRRLLAEYGPLSEAYYYSFDYEWFVRVSQGVAFTCLDETLATYRLHSQAKTGDWEANKHLFYADCRRINRKYAPLRSPRSWPLRWAQLWAGR